MAQLDLVSSAFAGGREFGGAGPYEQLEGTASFALDPHHAFNKAIVDLDLADHRQDGRAHFTCDIRILKPADPSRGNRRLVLDVVNRGNPVALRSLDLEVWPKTTPRRPGRGYIGLDSRLDPGFRGVAPGAANGVPAKLLGPPGRPATVTEGWLLQQGYTVVSCGWQHNVPPDTGRLGLRAPHATAAGRPLTGRIRCVQQVNAPTQVVGVADEPSGVQHLAYPVADIDDPAATLTERDYPLAPRRMVARDRWRFARLESGQVVPDRTHVFHEDGFIPGKIYEIIYTAEGAPVTGVGFAALRDTVSFLRFARHEEGNPCAGTIDHALAIGSSQTGRVLRQMLYLGFCVDEDDRLVLDGLLAIVAGPLRSE
ncbi:MAG: hypothetical protein KGJ86_03510, partial [Chloroflexota bacterium]|nr:hypothetical protein [Chloroflexota bacterium]